MPEKTGVQPEHLLQLTTIPDVQISPDGGQIAYVRSGIDSEADEYRTTIWLVDVHDGSERQLTFGPKRDSAPRWSPDGRSLAFLSDRDGDQAQLYVLPLAGGEARRLTALPLGAGPAEWSTDGVRIAFTARVSTEPRPDDAEARKRWEQRPRHITRAQYKDDGQGYTFGARSHLFVVAAAGGEPVQVTTGEENDRTPVWSPDGTKLAFIRVRGTAGDYNVSDLWWVAADGSAWGQLTSNVGRVQVPSWSPDGRLIACVGADDQTLWMGGEMTRVWLVAADGGSVDCLSKDYDRSPFLSPVAPPTPPAWSADGGQLTVSFADSGNVHLMRVAAGDGTVQPVVSGERQVLAWSRAASGRLAFVAATPTDPGDVYVCEADGGGERRLTAVNAAVLGGLAMPQIERRQFASPNGGSVDGWLALPDGDTRPAPLLVVIHGGPHSFAGTNFRTSQFFEYVAAARGWAVLALNPSGSGSYGAQFMQTLRGRWGEYDLPEQQAAIDALVQEGIADPERLAVTGYSYGGYMTSWVVGHTDRFKAAVIGAPVTNLESFYGTSDIGRWFGAGEMLGDLHSSREVFRRLSPVNYVDQVKTPCLILHGEGDDRCPIGQGEEFFAGLLATGNVPTEFVRYPGGSHSFVGQGRPTHRVDYTRRVMEWIERYTLKQG